MRPCEGLTLFLAALLAALMGLVRVSASHAAPIPDPLLAQLSSPDFAARAAASRRVMMSAPSFEELRDALGRTESLEARQRLLNAAWHLLVQRLAEQLPMDPSGDGAVGVSHWGQPAEQWPSLGKAGIWVRLTYPGFPGYVHLEPGDLILSIQGHGFTAGLDKSQIESQFEQRIRAIGMGKRVNLTVWRRGSIEEVSFNLASKFALTRVYEPLPAGGMRILDTAERKFQELREVAEVDALPALHIEFGGEPADASRESHEADPREVLELPQ